MCACGESPEWHHQFKQEEGDVIVASAQGFSAAFKLFDAHTCYDDQTHQNEYEEDAEDNYLRYRRGLTCIALHGKRMQIRGIGVGQSQTETNRADNEGQDDENQGEPRPGQTHVITHTIDKHVVLILAYGQICHALLMPTDVCRLVLNHHRGRVYEYGCVVSG